MRESPASSAIRVSVADCQPPAAIARRAPPITRCSVLSTCAIARGTIALREWYDNVTLP